MNYWIMFLRIIHILSGLFWFGSSLMMGFFITPAVAATGDAGKQFMGHMVNKERIHVVVSIAATLTILAGATLYWIDSKGLTSQWTWSGAGLVFGVGGILGLIGYIFGLLIGKNISILAQVGAAIQGKPTPEQMGKIQAAQKQLAYVGPISTYALILAVGCMAIARYWF